MKKRFFSLLCCYMLVIPVIGQSKVGIGTTAPSSLLHVKNVSSGNTFGGTPATVVVEGSGTTLLHIAGNTGSSSDKTGILLTDKPYPSFIHFYGPNQQLNLGVLGRNQLIVNNNGIVVHDRNNNPPVEASASLQVTSLNRGVLLPNLDLTQRNAIVNPASSLLVYQTDNDSGFYYNTATPGAPAWKKLLTMPDLSPLTLQRSEPRVGINETTPLGMLHIRNTDAQEDHLVMQDFFRPSQASMKFSNRHWIFQTTENFGSFWDFNNSTGFNVIRLTSAGDIDMKGNLTLGPFDKVGLNTASPSAPIHVVKTDISGGAFNSRSLMILEDNDHGYLQFSNPNNKEAGLLSGNSSTAIRSALIFGLDSSIALRTGGNSTRAFITKTGDMGIGTSAPEAKLDVNGTVKLGVNGTPFNGVIKVTINADVPSIAANATLTQTFSVTGATTGAVVYVSPKLSLPAGLVIAWARVSAANTVEVAFVNTTSSAINPAAMDYAIGVIL